MVDNSSRDLSHAALAAVLRSRGRRNTVHDILRAADLLEQQDARLDTLMTAASAKIDELRTALDAARDEVADLREALREEQRDEEERVFASTRPKP